MHDSLWSKDGRDEWDVREDEEGSLEGLEPAEVIEDWQPLGTWLAVELAQSRKEISPWFPLIALAVIGLALNGATWQVIMAVGVVLMAPIQTVLLRPVTIAVAEFSSISRQVHTKGSNGSGTTLKRPQKPK